MIDSLEFKPNLKEAVERMKRFWSLEDPLDRVPAIIYLPMSDESKADGSFFGRLDEYIKFMEDYFEKHSSVMDEYFPQVCPQYGHAIISALCGSQIKNTSHTVWSIPSINDLSEADDLNINWQNEWGRKFCEDYEILLDKAHDKYAIGVYEIEGISDTLSALRGSENMFYDFHENPSGAYKLANRVTDILIEFGEWGNKNIGEKQNILGGTTNGYNLWMPKGSCITAEDTSVMFSREYYRNNMKEHVERLASSFTRTLIEVHKEGTHQIKEFGETRGISMMTIENMLGMDENHRKDIYNLFGKRNFLVYVNPEDMEKVIEFTGIKGVILVTSAPSAKAANNILGEIEKITDRYKKQYG